jgi:hypothetical protein
MANGDIDQLHTLCGTKMSLANKFGTAHGTCGGLIKATLSDGTVECFGITVGHFLGSIDATSPYP